MYNRRDFNKIMALLPIAGAMPFSFFKSKEQEAFEVSETVIWQNSDIVVPEILEVNVQVIFDMEQIFLHGQLAAYQNLMPSPTIEIDIKANYKEINRMSNFKFISSGNPTYTSSKDGIVDSELNMAKVLQDGKDILVYHKDPKCDTLDYTQPVDISIDYKDKNNENVCNIFISEARLVSVSHNTEKKNESI